jgi:hypothetical protein
LFGRRFGRIACLPASQRRQGGKDRENGKGDGAVGAHSWPLLSGVLVHAHYAAKCGGVKISFGSKTGEPHVRFRD